MQALLTYSDHMVHHRPGLVVPDRRSPVGLAWMQATRKGDQVYVFEKKGSKRLRVLAGRLRADGRVRDGVGDVGEYRAPGLFPEVVAWAYRQVAELWALDNELAARWASWSFAQEHRDLKVLLAAFMLVQSRAGDPMVEDGSLLFFDEDYREVGEAMCLLRRRDGRDLNPRLLLRVGEVLALPQVAEINRALGFGRSARRPPMGRYVKAVTQWLRVREQNPQMLHGLARAGFRQVVMRLARKVGYKPLSDKFFDILRWKQKQAPDGRRVLAIGAEVRQAERWDDLSELEICERIVATRPRWQRVVGLLPARVGLTRAIMAAAIEAGCLSNADLVILSPTIEALGLLELPEIGDRWLKATAAAEDTRAARIAERMKGRQAADALKAAADVALQKAVAESIRGLRVYCAVDISGSMETSIHKARSYLSKFLQGFPLDKLTVCVFNTTAREVRIRHPSARGVEHAFKGFHAGGGTNHGAAFREVFHRHKPAPDEDALCIFVGDQQQPRTFKDAVLESGINPVAFGLLEVPSGVPGSSNTIVEDTARALDIPCFRIDEAMFDDVYAIPRTLRRLIAATPTRPAAAAAQSARVSLLEQILQTPLLTKPIAA